MLFLIFFSIYKHDFTARATDQEYPKEQAILTRVIDGDTIEVTGPVIGNKTHIRLLGLNSPEKNMPYSQASANFLKQFENKTVFLLRDKEDTDKYNRKLRYLFYENQLINLEILEKGFANSYYTSGLKYEKQILRAENQALQLEVGIWAKSNQLCFDCIKLVDLNATTETIIIENICNYQCELSGWFIKDAGRNTFYLNSMKSNEKQTIKSSKEVWNNDGDKFFLFDNNGKLVLYYSY